LLQNLNSDGLSKKYKKRQKGYRLSQNCESDLPLNNAFFALFQCSIKTLIFRAQVEAFRVVNELIALAFSAFIREFNAFCAQTAATLTFPAN
jgi:hypothetical protein